MLNKKNIYFTLPDNIVIGNNKSRNRLTLKIYFYLFYLFRFFIYKDSLFFFKDLINLLFDYKTFTITTIINNLNKYKLYLFKNIFIFVHKVFLFNSVLFIIYDNNFFYNISILNKYNYIKKFINNKNKLLIVLYKNFILRIPFIIFIGFKSYIYKFKIYKYNEYLSKNNIFLKYPLLNMLLKINKKKEFSDINVNMSYKIYFEKINKKNLLLNRDIRIKIYNVNNMKNFFHFFILFEKKIFIFLFNYLQIYFLNIFYLYLYNIWIFQLYANKDLIETYKWNIFYLFHLYWWLDKYIFELPIWLYIIIIINIIKLMFNNINNNNNFLSIIIDKKLCDKKNKELILIRINSLFFLSHFEKLYLKFFKMLKNKKINLSKIKYKKFWNIIIKHYLIDFLYLPVNYYNNYNFIKVYLKKFIYNIDKIHWKIFFNSDLNIRSELNTVNLNYLNIYLDNLFKSECNNFIVYNKGKNNLLINYFFFYYTLRDLYIKIIYKFDILIYQKPLLIIYYFRNNNIKILKERIKYNILFNIKNYYKEFFIYFYDRYIALIILVIFIKKYIK